MVAEIYYLPGKEKDVDEKRETGNGNRETWGRADPGGPIAFHANEFSLFAVSLLPGPDP